MARSKSRLETTAERIGTTLGQALNQVEAQVKNAKQQREVAIKHLVAVRDRANRLLADLGHAVAQARVPKLRQRRGRPPQTLESPIPPAATSSGEGLKKKRKPMSPEARARIAEAQRKRWAAQKRMSNK